MRALTTQESPDFSHGECQYLETNQKTFDAPRSFFVWEQIEQAYYAKKQKRKHWRVEE